MQHNRYYQSAGNATKNIILGSLSVGINYKKAKLYAHQDYAKQLCHVEKLKFKRIFTKLKLYLLIEHSLLGILYLHKLEFGSSIKERTVGITGLLYPGAAIKH